MKPIPVIGVFDIGKTNKKLFLFDEQYAIVFERAVRIGETTDEDGDACDNLGELSLFVQDALDALFKNPQFEIRAINISAYGASLVYTGENGIPLTPLYNYLKKYPAGLQRKFYDAHGGQALFSRQTASPSMGSLNAGLQLYRLKMEQPLIFKKIKYALHLPQYLSFLITGQVAAERTSIGCHTAMWNFQQHQYHAWLAEEGCLQVMPEPIPSDAVFFAERGTQRFAVGIGLHDSSATLIPYQRTASTPFVLVSTGTWSISLNPFNDQPLSAAELTNGCLCYLDHQGRPVKAGRLFIGFEHDRQVKRIADHFQTAADFYKTIAFNPQLTSRLLAQMRNAPAAPFDELFAHAVFGKRDVSGFNSPEEAYHQLLLDIVHQQRLSIQMILSEKDPARILVDGGFGNNEVFMNLLAASFPARDVFAAKVPQASAIGAAMVMHEAWNAMPLRETLVHTTRYLPAKELEQWF